MMTTLKVDGEEKEGVWQYDGLRQAKQGVGSQMHGSRQSLRTRCRRAVIAGCERCGWTACVPLDVRALR